MTKFIIRNDDIAFDTSLEEIKRFSEVCDKYGYKIIQSITPIGAGGRYGRAAMTNDQIKLLSFRRFDENKEVLEFLKARNDLIAVHGLWHTHVPSEEEVRTAKSILEGLGFNPTYFVPPFNEGDYQPKVVDLTTSQLDFRKGDLLETYLDNGEPTSPIMYLHSWRFQTGKYGYSFEKLDKCLARLSEANIEQ